MGFGASLCLAGMPGNWGLWGKHDRRPRCSHVKGSGQGRLQGWGRGLPKGLALPPSPAYPVSSDHLGSLIRDAGPTATPHMTPSRAHEAFLLMSHLLHEGFRVHTDLIPRGPQCQEDLPFFLPGAWRDFGADLGSVSGSGQAPKARVTQQISLPLVVSKENWGSLLPSLC